MKKKNIIHHENSSILKENLILVYHANEKLKNTLHK